MGQQTGLALTLFGQRGTATRAVICYYPFHVVQLATAALDKVRRGLWRDLRQLSDQKTARRFKARAGELKEELRAIIAGNLDEDEVAMMLDRFCSRASRIGLMPFVMAAQTIRKRRTRDSVGASDSSSTGPAASTPPTRRSASSS